MNSKLKNQFLTVMSFEYRTFLKNKIYVGITIAVAIILAIGLCIPTIIGVAKDLGVDLPSGQQGRTPEETLYVIDQTGLMSDLSVIAKQIPDERWQMAKIQDLEDLKQKVENKQAGGILLLKEPGSYTWIIRRAGISSLSEQIRIVVTQYFRGQALADLGLDASTISKVLSEPQMDVQETAKESGKTMGQTYLYTYLLVFLLYMTVMMYGQLVATSVASEKSNRAMEMLITSARPLNLMFGKVIGSGLAGLTQISIWLLTAAVFYKINEASWTSIAMIKAVFEMPPAIIVYTILFYLIGYFCYAFLYGALGSLASRTEDINTSIMPIILIFMVAFFVAVFGMLSPDAGWLVACSFIPFISPMAMFVRICMSDVPFWQIFISLSLMLATIWGTGWLASRIYRIGILMYGKPPKLNELARMLKNSR